MERSCLDVIMPLGLCELQTCYPSHIQLTVTFLLFFLAQRGRPGGCGRAGAQLWSADKGLGVWLGLSQSHVLTAGQPVLVLTGPGSPRPNKAAHQTFWVAVKGATLETGRVCGLRGLSSQGRGRGGPTGAGWDSASSLASAEGAAPVHR